MALTEVDISINPDPPSAGTQKKVNISSLPSFLPNDLIGCEKELFEALATIQSIADKLSVTPAEVSFPPKSEPSLPN
jgi:hypothetical protein